MVPSWYEFNCILRVRLSLCLLALNIQAHDQVAPRQLSRSNLPRAHPQPDQMQGHAARLCLRRRNYSAQARERERAVAERLCILSVETCSGPSACFWPFWEGGGGCARSCTAFTMEIIRPNVIKSSLDVGRPGGHRLQKSHCSCCMFSCL